MAQPIVTRIRGVLSSRTDEYFKDEDILDYANEAYQTVISEAIRLEMEQPRKDGRTIRALDALRANQTLENLTYAAFRNMYTSDKEVAQLLQLAYIGGSSNTCSPILFSEITPARKRDLDWGLLIPTTNQVYYQFLAGDKLQFFFCEDDTSVKLTIDYYKKPTLLVGNSVTLPDLPARLINAVVLRAALQGAVQENRENAESYMSMYEREIRAHLW